MNNQTWHQIDVEFLLNSPKWFDNEDFWVLTGDGEVNQGRCDRFTTPDKQRLKVANYGNIEAIGNSVMPMRKPGLPSSITPNSMAIDSFADAMKADIENHPFEWQDNPRCDAEKLSRYLMCHMSAGDPVAVANLAMMLHQRGEKIVATEAALAHAFSVLVEFWKSTRHGICLVPSKEARARFERASEAVKQLNLE